MKQTPHRPSKHSTLVWHNVVINDINTIHGPLPDKGVNAGGGDTLFFIFYYFKPITIPTPESRYG